MANEKKADEAGEGAVGFGGFGRNTLCFHTHHHCYLQYFLLKDTLQIRMVEHGLSTEVFFRQFDNDSLRSHARANWNATKKRNYFLFFPTPTPLQLADNKSLAVFISIRALDNI